VKENRQNKPTCQKKTKTPAISQKFKVVIMGMINNSISTNCPIQRIDVEKRAKAITEDRKIFYNLNGVRPDTKPIIADIPLAVKTLIKLRQDDIPAKPGNC